MSSIFNRLSIALALLCVLSLFRADYSVQPIACVQASSGDRSAAFGACVAHCFSQCPLLESLEAEGKLTADQLIRSMPPAPPELRVASPPRPLSFAERALRWDCHENCQYNCMRQHHAMNLDAAQSSPSAVKVEMYFGKWPFRRVFGVQELFSTLFSVANLAPHAYYTWQYAHIKSLRGYSLRKLWIAYGLLACNTWLWSSAFHARDTLLTERLDYYCASLTIAFAIGCGLIRILNARTRVMQALLLGTMLSLFALHVGYLQLVHFDYGWNMRVSMTFGLSYALLWLMFAFKHRQRAYVRPLVKSVIGLWLAASLEIFDFPPLFGDLLDAHACWHGATPIIAIWFWQFIRADSEYEHERHKSDELPQQYKRI